MMQARHLTVVAVGIAVLSVACAKPDLVKASSNKSEATIELYCHDGGSTNTDVPNTIYWDSTTKSVTWSLTKKSNVTDLVIGPKDPNAWPFVDATFTTTNGHSVKGKRLKTGLQGGLYQYLVRGVCTNQNGTKYTVGIDPDMIIPKTAFAF
ncbi:MAG: hypothetical protein ABJC63_11360 [Gemmatimonadales bacterium]